MWVRELLNDRKWHHGDLDRLGILVRHRGAENDERIILGSEILEIRANGLLVAGDAVLDEDAEEGTVFLPWHRVLKVTGPEGVLWERVTEEEP